MRASWGGAREAQRAGCLTLESNAALPPPPDRASTLAGVRGAQTPDFCHSVSSHGLPCRSEITLTAQFMLAEQLY